MCTLCDSTNIDTIIEFVPHVSGDGFNSGSDPYLQFRVTCGKRWNINVILDVTPYKEITWGCIWRTRFLKPRQSFRITLYFRKNSETLYIAKICTVGDDLFDVYRQTDRQKNKQIHRGKQKGVTKLMFAFRSFANGPNNRQCCLKRRPSVADILMYFPWPPIESGLSS